MTPRLYTPDALAEGWTLASIAGAINRDAPHEDPIDAGRVANLLGYATRAKKRRPRPAEAQGRTVVVPGDTLARAEDYDRWMPLPAPPEDTE